MPLKSEIIFQKIEDLLKLKGPQLVKKLNGIVRFDIYEEKGGPYTQYTYDLKNGNGVILLII